MKNNKILIIVVALFLLLTGVIQTVHAASGWARVYYNSSLSVSTTLYTQTILHNFGYSVSRSADPTKNTLLDSFFNSKAVHIHTHGSPGALVCQNGNLTANDINNRSGSLSNLQLVYLSACKAGASSSVNGSIPPILAAKGAKSVVAFTENILASTDSNGIHYFNQMVYYYLANGYTLYNSVGRAMSDVYYQYGGYAGANSAVVLGGSIRAVNFQ